jgi:CheY-like chemotaxis protein
MILRDIPVIMLTMVDDTRLGMTLGASDYVTKPVNRRRLSKILERFTCANPPCPILVVDDDPATRASMRKMLEKQGCRVSEAANGEEALASMESDRPTLIFLDLLMPVMDGFTFADRARRHPDWRTIPIVVVTAHDLTKEETLRLNGYVEMVLNKDGCTREQMMEQVRDALDKCVPSHLVAVEA